MKKVVVAPLDWGLGHATRCIPVIRELLNEDFEVLIAGSGSSLALLKIEFPQLDFIELTGYHPSYPSSGSMMVWEMARQLPRFISAVKREHREIEKHAAARNIDLIISDNRYGCWSDKIYSVIITHQSNVMMPARFGWLSTLVRRAIARQLQRFSACWIPDFPDHRLSGLLSDRRTFPRGQKIDYIGGVSRLEAPSERIFSYDVVLVLSGPEPQRTILETLVEPQLAKSGLRYFIARGLPAKDKNNRTPFSADFLTSAEMQHLLASAAVVISRSGYSTILDLARMQKKAILIPTPGQTEQEYLAREFDRQGVACCYEQSAFDLEVALKKSESCTGFVVYSDENELLKLAVKKLAADLTGPPS